MDLYLREGGRKLEYLLEKKTDSQPENWHYILEVKIHHPNRELHPHPLTLVINLLGHNVSALTHWTTGCRIQYVTYTYSSITGSSKSHVHPVGNKYTEYLKQPLFLDSATSPQTEKAFFILTPFILKKLKH